MPVSFKVFFSIASAVLYVFVCLAKRVYNEKDKPIIGDTKQWWSIGLHGFDISFWPLVANTDGTFKRYGKLFILVVFVCVNLFMWLHM